MQLKTISSLIILASTLVACNGGGNPSPTSTTQYGRVLAESQQNLGENQQINALFQLMRVYGKYESADSSVEGFQQVNVDNTIEAYNFNVNYETDAPGALWAESVAAYAIQYNTPGATAETRPEQISRTVSGLIIVPQLKPGKELRGVVVYFHPTRIGKNQVPSCLDIASNRPDYCNITALDNSGTNDLAQFSALFAARGFAVLAPDFVGQGVDYSAVHPYMIYPVNNVLSAFNMFPALRQILARDFALATTQELPLFITGFSEGGGYALKAAEMAQSTSADWLQQYKLKLTLTAPQEGAYSLPDQMNFAFANLYDGMLNCPSGFSGCGTSNMMQADQNAPTESVANINSWNIVSSAIASAAKPALTSYVLTATGYYRFKNIANEYNVMMNTQFWSQIPLEGNIANLYELYSGIYGSRYTGSQIQSAIITNTIGKINGYGVPTESRELSLYWGDTQLGAPLELGTNSFLGNNNQAGAFINQGIQTNPIFIQLLSSGSTYNWRTTTPINFIHLAYDSLVAGVSTKQAYSCMKYGQSYVASSANQQSSSAPCNSANANSAMIESTLIQNFQWTNNLIQLSPQICVLGFCENNPQAQSKFWTTAPAALGLSDLGVYMPMDHGNMDVIGDIVALCAFENSLATTTNSGRCPNF